MKLVAKLGLVVLLVALVAFTTLRERLPENKLRMDSVTNLNGDKHMLGPQECTLYKGVVQCPRIITDDQVLEKLS